MRVNQNLSEDHLPPLVTSSLMSLVALTREKMPCAPPPSLYAKKGPEQHRRQI